MFKENINISNSNNNLNNFNNILNEPKTNPIININIKTLY